VAVVGAQQRLTVNGVEVAGLTTELVPGTAYILAEPFARAVGARCHFDAGAGLVAFDGFGGRLVTLRAFESPRHAAQAERALTVDAQARSSFGAVFRGGEVYVPVKSLSNALGGSASYLAELRTVAVVFPRPELLDISPPSVWGTYERFVLSFSAPVAVQTTFEPSLNLARFRFPRAVLGARRSFRGERFADASFVPDLGYVNLDLNLYEGNTFSTFSTPHGEGVRVIIDIFAAPSEAAPEAPPIVLDPGEGTLEAAKRLQRMLRRRGRQVRLTWAGGVPDPEARMRAGIGAPLFVSLARAPLPEGRFNLYYLEGEAATLAADIRQGTENAPEALSPRSRALLARLAPDLGRGPELARRLRRRLEARTELRLGTLMGAPVYVLSGAAGRGVMLELSPRDLARPELIPVLADALAALGAP